MKGTHKNGQSARASRAPHNKKQRVLLIGGGAREHALGEALCKTSRTELFVFAHNLNPGLEQIASEFKVGDEKNAALIVEWARSCRIDFAVIGLEDPLAVGVPDALEGAGIPTVGPVRAAARLETSKLFLRELMERHQIDGEVAYRFVTNEAELETYLRQSGHLFALKPVGLTAGKGVKVMGVQLHSLDDAIAYGKEVIRTSIGGVAGVLLEERLEGAEFTLQAFVDGNTVAPMPLVKDYKLSEEGDTGENTGSMGSYSQANGSLDFVGSADRTRAVRILEAVVAALRSEKTRYKGIIYGQFMKTRAGVKLIEINARFGDPEAINVLSLLDTDFVDICSAILDGGLSKLPIQFARKATVCKYLTPPDYPKAPKENAPISWDLPKIRKLGVQVLFAKVRFRMESISRLPHVRSRCLEWRIPFEKAHLQVEAALAFVHGEYHMRHDIGTQGLINRAFMAVDADRTTPESSLVNV